MSTPTPPPGQPLPDGPTPGQPPLGQPPLGQPGQPGQPVPGYPQQGQPYPGQPGFGAPAGAQPWQPVLPPPPAPAPVWAVVAVFGSVLALVAVILPWFHPALEGNAIPGAGEIRAWQGGRISLFGPIILVLAGIFWIREILKPTGAAAKAATFSIVAGAVGLATAGLGWVLAPKAYRDWDETKQLAENAGLSLTIGPQLGFWLLIAASVIVLAVGVAAKLLPKRG